MLEQLLQRFTPGTFIGLVAVIGGILGWIITTVAAQWRRVRVAEIEASLKQQMLERGMGAAEIEQVLRSKSRGSGSGEVAQAGCVPSAKASIVKALTEGGYEGEDMERILRAYGQHPDVQAVVDKEGQQRAEAFNRAVSAKVGIVKMMAENGNSTEEIERVLGAYNDDAEWRIDHRQPAAVS
jgi:hypothetical protein